MMFVILGRYHCWNSLLFFLSNRHPIAEIHNNNHLEQNKCSFVTIQIAHGICGRQISTVIVFASWMFEFSQNWLANQVKYWHNQNAQKDKIQRRCAIYPCSLHKNVNVNCIFCIYFLLDLCVLYNMLRCILNTWFSISLSINCKGIFRPIPALKPIHVQN